MKKEVIETLEQEKVVLEERLGNIRLALRGFGIESTSSAGTLVKSETRKKRAFVSSEQRQKYNDEIIAVIEAFGPATTAQLYERGNFDGVSSTTVYRLALEHPRLETKLVGRKRVFSLK